MLITKRERKKKIHEEYHPRTNSKIKFIKLTKKNCCLKVGHKKNTFGVLWFSKTF